MIRAEEFVRKKSAHRGLTKNVEDRIEQMTVVPTAEDIHFDETGSDSSDDEET